MSTAEEVLQRCKDIMEGRHSQPEPFTIKKTGSTRWSVYYPTGALMADWYEDEIGSSTTAIFARILGMDSEPAPAPEVVLEWVEDEMRYGSIAHHTHYNNLIECYISMSEDGKAKFAWIAVNKSRVFSMPESPAKTQAEARAWCEGEIYKIVTAKP